MIRGVVVAVEVISNESTYINAALLLGGKDVVC